MGDKTRRMNDAEAMERLALSNERLAESNERLARAIENLAANCGSIGPVSRLDSARAPMKVINSAEEQGKTSHDDGFDLIPQFEIGKVEGLGGD